MNQFEDPVKRQPEERVRPPINPEEQEQLYPGIEVNEIDVGPEGQIIVKNVRRDETAINKPSSTEGVDEELAKKFGLAQDYLELLPEADRDIILNKVQKRLVGVVPTDYDRERQMAIVDEVSKKMLESRADRSAKSD